MSYAAALMFGVIWALLVLIACTIFTNVELETTPESYRDKPQPEEKSSFNLESLWTVFL